MDRLINIRDNVQKLSKFHQLEIFRIFKTRKIIFTENRNGIFINMNDLDKVTLNAMEKYLRYVSTQQLHLDTIEKQKQKIKKSFFKNNKDICIDHTHG